jgi:AraC-like DNA-binding protein
MTKHPPSHTRRIDSFEELNSVVSGSRSEVVQLERGAVRGFLTHLLIRDLPLTVGSSSVGVRARGVLSDDRVTFGMLTGCTNRVTHWCYEMRPGDVLLTPPGVAHDGRYYGGASFAVISLSSSDIKSVVGTEPRLRELAILEKGHFRPDAQVSTRAIDNLQRLVAQLEADDTTLTRDAAEFWKCSIIETMVAAVAGYLPLDRDGPIPSASRIVRKVDEYIDAAGLRPVHIAEICNHVNVSRRTLHRAFYDAVGQGPVEFLRYRRLCAIHSILRTSNPQATTIANVALEHGFLNLGRFSGYYRSLFGEYPSQTLGQIRHH